MHLAIATLDLNLRLPQYDMRSISSYLHLDTNIIRISPLIVRKIIGVSSVEALLPPHQ